MNERVNDILLFLKEITVNNNREWFVANKTWYEDVRGKFESMVSEVLLRIGTFDASVQRLSVKDCTYRFNRDTRFSPDKSPYKRHFGAYINSHGKKSSHGGYYFHLEPGCCLIAGGAYCLPSPVLRAVRQSVVDNTDEFRKIVEKPEFHQLFPVIGEDHVKTMPKGFPKDFPYPQYLRCKDYSCCLRVNEDYLAAADWLDRTGSVFQTMKPFLDFVNYTIDDME